MRQFVRTLCHILIGAWLLLALPCAYGQITLDGTLGTAGALAGPNYLISAAVGQTRGSNLFHSFGVFNILQGESATFTGPNTVSNVIGRVTGGQQSTINGLLKSEIAGANVYLINPAGILFGPYVQLDVGGSFHASTADYLKFADGAKFYAELGKTSTLTTAPVSAFGFLSATPAGITIDQRLDDLSIPLRPRFQVQPGETISLIGGEIHIIGSPRTAFGKDNEPTLFAPSGNINLISVASSGEATLDVSGQAAGIDVIGFSALGNITLSNDALVSTSSDPADGRGNGTIVVRGNNLSIASNGYLFADTKGDMNGAQTAIDIDLTGRLSITSGGRITSDRDRTKSEDGTGGAGNAGNVVIKAKEVEVSGMNSDGLASIIAARLFPGSTGAGGSIDIAADTVRVFDRGRITTESAGRGSPGSVHISADEIALDGGGSIISSATLVGTGGSIVMNATRVALTEGAAIAARSSGTGNAGNLAINASDALTLTDSTISTEAVRSDGGNISLSVGTLLQLGDSRIASAVGSGSGQGGNITIDPTFVILKNSQISANAFGGPGGNVSIVADVFLTSGNSSVTASSELNTPGTVDIQAPITDLSGTLTPLPENVVQATALLRQSCAMRYASGKLSSLSLASRGGLPFEPGQYMANYTQGDSFFIGNPLGSPDRNYGHDTWTSNRLGAEKSKFSLYGSC